MDTSMKRNYLYIVSILALVFFPTFSVNASQLIYQPVNPAFGGFSGNGNVLLNNANVQNDFGDPNADSSGYPGLNRDPLENFKDSLNRQVLTLIARKVVEEAFGTDTGLGSGGTYTTDGYEITITPDTDAINISITDTLTGDTTSLIVPVFDSGV